MAIKRVSAAIKAPIQCSVFWARRRSVFKAFASGNATAKPHINTRIPPHTVWDVCMQLKSLCFSLEIITRQLLEACTTCGKLFYLWHTHATNSSLTHSLRLLTSAGLLCSRLYFQRQLFAHSFICIGTVIDLLNSERDKWCNLQHVSPDWLAFMPTAGAKKWSCLINIYSRKREIRWEWNIREWLFCFSFALMFLYNWPRYL